MSGEDKRYTKHQKRVTKLLRRKARDYADDQGHQYYACHDHEMWLPTREDVPSLVESIKFWKSVRPPGRAEDWNDFQVQMYLEVKKKEMICYSLLGKVPDMWDVALKAMNGRTTREPDRHDTQHS